MFQMENEIAALRKIITFNSLTILVDQRTAVAIPEINKYARQLSNEHTMPVNIVDVGNSAQETLAAIPAGTDAVMEKGSDLFTIFFGRHCSLFENRIPSL